MDLPLKNQTLHLPLSHLTSRPELNHMAAPRWKKAGECLFWQPCVHLKVLIPKQMGRMPPEGQLATSPIVSIHEKPQGLPGGAYGNFANGLIFRKYCFVTLFLTQTNSDLQVVQNKCKEDEWCYWVDLFSGNIRSFQNFSINWYE